MKKSSKIVDKFFLDKFIAYGLHLGSVKSFWIPDNKPYLVGLRNNFCIFNANLTFLAIRRAVKYLRIVILSNKKILFVGSPLNLEKEFSYLCKKSGHYHIEKWVYGFFTNYQKDLIKKHDNISKISQQPALIFIFDLSKDSVVLQEARSQDIPIMAFVNSNERQKDIDYPIPGNVLSSKGGLFLFNFFYHLLTAFSSKSLKRNIIKI